MLACWRGLGVSFLRCGEVLLPRWCEVGAARALRVVVVWRGCAPWCCVGAEGSGDAETRAVGGGAACPHGGGRADALLWRHRSLAWCSSFADGACGRAGLPSPLRWAMLARRRVSWGCSFCRGECAGAGRVVPPPEVKMVCLRVLHHVHYHNLRYVSQNKNFGRKKK
jgi:hypothetical protein